MRLLIFLVTAMACIQVQAGEHYITKESSYSVNETVQRIESFIDQKKPIGILGRVDHQANAKGVSLPLNPTYLLIFGNPSLGTKLMQENPEVGIDLPMKMLVWEDDAGKVWLTYLDPRALAMRHHLEKTKPILEKMAGVLNKMSNEATGQTQ